MDIFNIWAEHNIGNDIRNISFLGFPRWAPSIFSYKPCPEDPGHSKLTGCCSPLVAKLIFIAKFSFVFHSQQGHGLLFQKFPRLKYVLKTLAEFKHSAQQALALVLWSAGWELHSQPAFKQRQSLSPTQGHPIIIMTENAVQSGENSHDHMFWMH